VIHLPEIETSRLIDAEWEDSEDNLGEKYVAEIKVYAINRNGLLADVSRALTEKDINILALNTRANKQNLATMAITIEISGKDELARVIDKMRSIESVVDIERTIG
jgi:GTP pyrophosphokinase